MVEETGMHSSDSGSLLNKFANFPVKTWITAQVPGRNGSSFAEPTNDFCWSVAFDPYASFPGFAFVW